MNTTDLRAVLSRIVFLGGIWLVLTGAGTKGLFVGALAVPAATWLSLRLLPAGQSLNLLRLAGHIPSFVAGSVMGGLDVGRRALSPRMRLAPGWVEVPVTLPDGGRVALGAELSLMLGTLAAGTQDGRLLVHVLDTEAGYERAIPREAAAIAAMIPAGNGGGLAG